MTREWIADKAWADGYWDDVETIIRRVAGRIVTVSAASLEEDQKFARDYVVATGTIACRLRRPDRWRWRGIDITIRATRPRSGYLTDLDKFRRGDVNWFLFGWTQDGHVGAWVFVDVAKMVAAELDAGRDLIPNFDGSSDFIPVPVADLVEAGALVDCELDQPTHLQMRRRTAEAR